MKRENVEYKKITVELPISTYNNLKKICKEYPPYRKFFYKDVINLAIIDYLKKLF